MSELKDFAEFDRDILKKPLYYLGGIIKEPDPHTVTRLKNLPTQRDRAKAALLYSLEIAGIYENSNIAFKEREHIREEIEKLPNEGDGNKKVATDVQIRASELKTRYRGLSAMLLLNKGVEADVRYAETIYDTHFFSKEGGSNPMLDLDKIVELYDKTDELADESPMILTIRAMHGLDSDSRHEAERIGRLLLLEESQVSATTN